MTCWRYPRTGRAILVQVPTFAGFIGNIPNLTPVEMSGKLFPVVLPAQSFFGLDYNAGVNNSAYRGVEYTLDSLGCNYMLEPSGVSVYD